uniref:G-protein coupled receptors family 1 profile domain-containing protein n=1 Tax=Lates calcarifer TaxID=8187 RepID=A0A4W6EMI0_LATCA
MDKQVLVPVATHEDQNSTNGNNCSSLQLESIDTVVPIYILVIAVLGIIFNVFVLMVFCLHKKACTVAEIYLSNLAAADLILVSCLPFWAVYAVNNFNWPFGGAMCKLVNISITMNVCCSIYFLVLVSIDRYMALVHPLSHETLRRPKFAKLSCLLVWALGLLLSVPTLIYREVENLPDINATVCYLQLPKYHCNAALPLWSWLAQVLVGCSLDTIVDICKQIFTYLAFFNSVLNPILYVIVGKNFRRKVKELFKQWSRKRTATLSLNSTRTSTLTSLSRSVKAADVSGMSTRL